MIIIFTIYNNIFKIKVLNLIIRIIKFILTYILQKDLDQLKKKILFRADFGSEIGFGHIIRCLNLASLFIKNNFEVTLITKKKKYQFPFLIKKLNILHLKEKISIAEESKFIQNYFTKKKFSFLFLDIEHGLINKKKYEIFLEHISKILNKTICWDNLLSNKFKFGITYRPYPNFVNLKKIYKKSKIVQGLNYLYIPNIYRYSKKIKTFNLLVNLGGTSQRNKIESIIKKIETIRLKKKLKVVIPNFNLKKSLKLNHHKYCFPKFVNNNKIYKNINLAIVSGGMAKYECIINQIPSIVINLNSQQKKINQNFIKYNFIIILKKLDELDKKLKLLIFNQNLREKLIYNCIKLRKNYKETRILKELTSV